MKTRYLLFAVPLLVLAVVLVEVNGGNSEGPADVSERASSGPERTGLGASPELPGVLPPARDVVAPSPTDAEREQPVDETVVRSRVATLTKQLALSSAEADKLVSIFLEEQRRRAAAIRDLRRGSPDGAVQAAARRQLAEIEAWKSQELYAQLGQERAESVTKRRGQ